MAHIKEPYGVDFLVENKPVTEEDKKLISNVILHYKKTGKIIMGNKAPAVPSKKRQTKSNILKRKTKIK